MKKIAIAMFSVILALGLSISEAEAKRMGGGQSVGMQRQSVSPKPTPTQQAAPAAPAAAGAPAAAPKRNWMGPLAGLAAGLGIAALLSHFGMGEGVANFLMIALLAIAAIFVFKLLFRRPSSAAQTDQNLQYAGQTPQSAPQPELAYPAAANSAGTSAQTIAGFDSEAFLRIAKLNFVRLQAANDSKNLDDMREFLSPEVFAEIKMQMDERDNSPQQTDIVTLDASLLEVVSEANRHIASVHFSGMIRESANAPAQAFAEIWHLTKPADGSRGWTVAGLQQLS